MVQNLKLIHVHPSKTNPRKHFDENELAQLADNIKTHGVLQPVPRAAKNGGGRRVKAEVEKAVPTKKFGEKRRAAAEVPATSTPEKRMYRKVCDKHGPYTASGGRSACPACNPRVVTAKEAFAS